jgi:hypothetical protein
LDAPAAVEVWSKLTGGADTSETLKAFGKVGTLAEGLLWSRQNFGYDLMLPWSVLDRPAEEFVSLLEYYRKVANPL